MKPVLTLFSGLLFLLLMQPVYAVNNFVKGSFSAIQQAHQDNDYLVVFWGQDCAYCMKELASLGPFLEQNPEIKLVTVATDPFLDTRFVEQTMAEFGLSDSEHWVFASDYPATLYFDVNRRWRGELPYTGLSQPDGLVFKSGLTTVKDFNTWLDSLR